MSDTIIYLIKVSAGIGIICIPYSFIIRYDPNLNLKRFYLLCGLLAAWIFPFLAFRRPDMLVNLTPVVMIDPLGSDLNPVSISGSGSSAGITINWIKVLLLVYLTGFLFMFFKNIVVLMKWNRTFRTSTHSDGIAFTKSDQVFTIFSRIFIPGTLKNKNDFENILLHEKAHVEQFHYIDLMLMEITLLLTWFNPFSWLISRMIKENHEHLADRQVLSAGVNAARYRAQLLNHTLGVNVFRLGNQFNHSLTLKRFKMMKKPTNSRKGIIKMMMLIPAVLITMGLTTGMTPQGKTVKGKVILADSGENATGAAVVISATSMGTVVDKDGYFTLDVDGDPEIVISSVGYKSLRIKSSKIGNKPLKLQPTPYNIDLESVKAEDLKSVKVEKDVVVLTPKEAKKAVDGNVSEKDDEPVFYIVEDMPMFPGGKAALKKYIYTNLVYPESAKKKGINGEVLVQFLVTTSGEIEDIRVTRSTYEGFDKAAKEVFKNMPDWNPGKQRGKAVNVQVVVPVKFVAEKN